MKRITMMHLYIVALGMLTAGGLLLAGALLLSLDALWTLTGLMLTVAGAFTTIMVMIWTRIAKLGTPDHRPEKPW